jgi:hypothetical protein
MSTYYVVVLGSSPLALAVSHARTQLCSALTAHLTSPCPHDGPCGRGGQCPVAHAITRQRGAVNSKVRRSVGSAKKERKQPRPIEEKVAGKTKMDRIRSERPFVVVTGTGTEHGDWRSSRWRECGPALVF